MKIKASESRYVKSEDLQGKTPTVSISHVTVEEVGQQKDKKYILYFQGKKKGMVLNATNRKRIIAAYGDESDNWANRQVTLCTEMTSFGGVEQPGLRIRIPTNGKPAQAQAPVDAPQVQEEWTDAADAQAEEVF